MKPISISEQTVTEASLSEADILRAAIKPGDKRKRQQQGEQPMIQQHTIPRLYQYNVGDFSITINLNDVVTCSKIGEHQVEIIFRNSETRQQLPAIYEDLCELWKES